jgi:hypothetical protein
MPPPAYGYEVQYLDNNREAAGYECAQTLAEARRVAKEALKRFLPPNYELRYAIIANIRTGESVSAYRTTPEGSIRQIPIDELPES